MRMLLIALLGVSAVLAQPIRREAIIPTPTVLVEHIQPNCAALGQTDMMQQLASGCFWDRVQITAKSGNPRILGFLITATYIDSNGKTKTETKAVIPGVPVYMASVDGGNFVAAFVPADLTFIGVTAIEILTGQTVSTP